MLIEHPTLAQSSEDLRTCLVKMLSKAAAGPGPRKVEVTPAEHRAYSLFSRTAELDNCLRSMRVAVSAMNSEGTSASPDAEQYRYQAENFLLRLTGLYDRALRLVGIALGLTDLAVDHPQANRRVHRAVSEAEATVVEGRLKDLKALIDPHRDDRNVVAHSGEFSSRELGLLGGIAKTGLDSVSPDDLRELMTHHFKSGALDFGALTLQAEALLYQLLSDLRSPATAAEAP